jgi:hypothetical protein
MRLFWQHLQNIHLRECTSMGTAKRMGVAELGL